MMRSFAVSAAVVIAAVFAGAASAAEQKMLAHDVYFSLNDNSAQGTQKLIAACEKYLAGHPGTVWFAVGPMAEEFKRDVNDRDFDVALHIVFQNKAAHDSYQNDARHQKFIEETQASWKKVRVFDSYLSVGRKDGEKPAAGKPAGQQRKRAKQ